MGKKLWGLIVLAFLSCSTPLEKNISPGNKFDDLATREIYDLQDKRDSDGLIPYLDRQEADYRREAALAFASVQDSSAIPHLIKLLHDEFVDVRLAAAYALGQIKNDAAESGILNALDEETVPLVRRELWESLGKCASQNGIEKILSYSAGDSLEKEGISWGIYRIGLRGKASPEITAKAVDYLRFENSYQTRLASSHYLSRTRGIAINDYQEQIAESARKDASPFVRMASARALGKSDDNQFKDGILHSIIADEPDPRVIINALNALPGIDEDRQVVKTLLKNPDINVEVAAAEFVTSHARLFQNDLEPMLNATGNWRASAELIGAGIGMHETMQSFSEKARDRYSKSNNIYEKAWLLRALGNSPENHEFVWNQVKNTEVKVISTNGVSALASMKASPDFNPALNNTFIDYFKECISSGDLAMIGIASGVLSNPAYNYKELIKDYSFLHNAESILSLPKDNEALQTLERTIDYFEDRTPSSVVNEYNHPIDWNVVAQIPEGQKAILQTSKGKIILELLVDESPGSVENFYTLASNHYYDGKTFHRVVPNFVIQGGDPRGDGWGGEDYSIRSEFGMLRYKEGAVGMASAGKDTEGVQWFITHSPTPHLDGSYSIFAQVVEGMNVVNAIEVGDTITSIEFPK